MQNLFGRIQPRRARRECPPLWPSFVPQMPKWSSKQALPILPQRIQWGANHQADLKNDNLILSEKPKLKFKVNTGLYILESNIMKLIKTKSVLDFNTLLNKSIQNKKKIGYYEIKDKDWIDVGQMDKYKYFLNKEI